MDILAQINASGTAVMLVTHDPTVAARVGRVMFMRDGRIMSELKLSEGDMAGRLAAVTEKMRELGI